MFLKICSIMILSLGFSAVSEAQSIPGLSAKTYRLTSLVKGKHAVSKNSPDREEFCGEEIQPEVSRGDNGTLILTMSARLGFEWKELNSLPGELMNGCHYGTVQTIEQTREGSKLVIENIEECKNGKSLAGSRKDELHLRGNVIVYHSGAESRKDGQWVKDPSKRSFTCTWTAKN